MFPKNIIALPLATLEPPVASSIFIPKYKNKFLIKLLSIFLKLNQKFFGLFIVYFFKNLIRNFFD